MEENGWLRHLLENMQNDIDEIRHDVKSLREWKWKLAGGIAVVAMITTIAFNLAALWVRL